MYSSNSNYEVMRPVPSDHKTAHKIDTVWKEVYKLDQLVKDKFPTPPDLAKLASPVPQESNPSQCPLLPVSAPVSYELILF